SGSLRFTSVRAASLRASGLAARNKALEGTGSVSHSIVTNRQFSEQHTAKDNGTDSKVGEDVDQPHVTEANENGLRNAKKGKFGFSTVRKLPTEVSFDENKSISYNSNTNAGGEDLLQLPISDAELAGLSYVDSQEPGEASQANALEFVDRLINCNYLEFEQEVEPMKSTGGKSKPGLSAKGPQILAKKVNDRSTVGKTGIFYWDDNCEDEGGGDIFKRRREEFLGSGISCLRSLSKTRKPQKSGIDYSRYNREQPHANIKLMMQSDSRLVLLKSKMEGSVQEAEIKFRKNLAKDFDEHINADSTKEQSEANVGFDTQVAAEAMEALCNQESITYNEAKEEKMKKRVCSKQKRLCLSDKVAARQSERIGAKSIKMSSVTSKKRSRGSREDFETELVMEESKRGKQIAERCFSGSKCGSLDKMPSEIIQQEKAGLVLTNSKVDEFDMSHGTVKSSVGSPVKKRYELKKVDISTPIACRTRRSMVAHQMERAENAPGHSGEDTNPQMEVGAIQDNTVSETYAETFKMVDAEKESSTFCSSPFDKRESVKPNQHEESMSKLREKSNAIDVLGHPRRRRSQRSLSSQANGYDQHQKVDKPGAQGAALAWDSLDVNRKRIQKDLSAKANHSRKNIDADSLPLAEQAEIRLDKSPREKSKPSDTACTTPISCRTPVNAASPVCMGNEYLEQTCKRNLSKVGLKRELGSLSAMPQGRTPVLTDSRKRRDMSNVKVLFSHHLDEDIIKQQKKAIERIGRSALKDENILNDLLILSCEEDYAICIPLLEKGAAVYSSELLLNGIVTQKLEYERLVLSV
ncbi:hypothetical protein CFOL_v3_36277, partial [Cephalotus follicularis]